MSFENGFEPQLSDKRSSAGAAKQIDKATGRSSDNSRLITKRKASEAFDYEDCGQNSHDPEIKINGSEGDVISVPGQDVAGGKPGCIPERSSQRTLKPTERGLEYIVQRSGFTMTGGKSSSIKIEHSTNISNSWSNNSIHRRSTGNNITNSSSGNNSSSDGSSSSSTCIGSSSNNKSGSNDDVLIPSSQQSEQSGYQCRIYDSSVSPCLDIVKSDIVLIKCGVFRNQKAVVLRTLDKEGAFTVQLLDADGRRKGLDLRYLPSRLVLFKKGCGGTEFCLTPDTGVEINCSAESLKVITIDTALGGNNTLISPVQSFNAGDVVAILRGNHLGKEGVVMGTKHIDGRYSIKVQNDYGDKIGYAKQSASSLVFLRCEEHTDGTVPAMACSWLTAINNNVKAESEVEESENENLHIRQDDDGKNNEIQAGDTVKSRFRIEYVDVMTAIQTFSSASVTTPILHIPLTVTASKPPLSSPVPAADTATAAAAAALLHSASAHASYPKISVSDAPQPGSSSALHTNATQGIIGGDNNASSVNAHSSNNNNNANSNDDNGVNDSGTDDGIYSDFEDCGPDRQEQGSEEAVLEEKTDSSCVRGTLKGMTDSNGRKEGKHLHKSERLDREVGGNNDGEEETKGEKRKRDGIPPRMMIGKYTRLNAGFYRGQIGRIVSLSADGNRFSLRILPDGHNKRTTQASNVTVELNETSCSADEAISLRLDRMECLQKIATVNDFIAKQQRDKIQREHDRNIANEVKKLKEESAMLKFEEEDEESSGSEEERSDMTAGE